ncbi:MAG: Fe-S cluster assembly protein SufD [bacterium]
MPQPTPFLSSLATFVRPAASADAPWLGSLRDAAMSRFGELGLPSTRHEAWRYTNIEPIARTAFRLAEAASASAIRPEAIAPHSLGGAAVAELVFVDGHYAPHLSNAAAARGGLRVDSLAAALRERPAEVEPHLGRVNVSQAEPFTALNSAFVQDGALIQVARGVAIEKPIHLVFIASGASEPIVSHPRVLIVAQEASEITVVERFVTLGAGTHFTNAVTEIVLGPAAVIEHVKLEREGTHAFHVGSLHVRQARASQLASRWIALGGGLVRNEIRTILDGEGATATLDGLTVGADNQHVDSQTSIEHAQPHCESRQLYKSVLDGAARSVFNGRVLVAPHAQKTNAQQVNRNLLISKDARADTKPQLEIYADDVKCSHGATIGKLDPAAIFYLRSRGLGESEARSVLTQAFAGEVVARVRAASVRAELEEWLSAWSPVAIQEKA